jgi:hypothetical protein
MPNLTDREEFQIYAIIQGAESRIDSGAEITMAFEWLYEELHTFLVTGIELYDYEEQKEVGNETV